MKTIYKVKVAVFSSVGVFSGFLPAESDPDEGTAGYCEVKEYAMLGNPLTYLVLENDDGTKIKVPQAVLENAVLQTEVVEIVNYEPEID